MLAEADFVKRSNLGVLLCDLDGIVLAMGGGLRRALSLAPHAVPPRHLSDLFRHADGRPCSTAGAIEHLQRSTAGLPVECRLATAGGLDAWFLATLSTMQGQEEKHLLVELTPINTQHAAIAEAAKELEHLSSALDATGQGVWDYNGATGVWYFSPAWKRMRGIPDDENYFSDGFDWLENIHPDDREVVQTVTERQYAGELEEVAFEYRERHRAGHWIWIHARGRSLEGCGDGKPLRIVGTDTDMTVLKASQAALGELKRSELRWKIAVDSAAQGVWDHDLVTGERYYSQTWRAIRGLDPQAPVSDRDDDWLDRVHPDDRERVAADMAQCIAGGSAQISLEFRERDQQGGWLWILRRGRPVAQDAAGRPTRLVGTDTVVSDIKARELEFEALSRRLEMALATSAVGLWENNLETGDIFWDARTRELFNMVPSRGAIPAGTWESLLHPEDRDRIIALCKEGLETVGGYACDYRVLLPGNVIRHVRCRASIVSTEGVGNKIVGVNWDVTADVELADALRRAKQLAEDHSRDLEAAHRRMEHASLHDSLTGLPNRRYLDQALSSFTTEGSPSLVLLHIDIDRFKQINDTKGHAAGDALLVHFARLLRSQVNGSDVVARIGGDEFVVLMSPAPDPSLVQATVDGILTHAARPMLWQGQECRSGVSIGIADSIPGVDARQLLVNADIALYRAKGAGRNCACRFTDSLQEEIVTKKQCADDILKGLERGEFVPWFQLQFDARTLDIVGLEALVRWNHPVRGLLLPGSFIDVAAEINAMATIDRLVLEQAAKAMAHWDSIGVRIPHVSVNVSARRLGDPGLIASLLPMPIEPSRISFELLESIFLDEEDQILSANIEALKALGFKIEIDDFGTGHASIASLLRIRPHRLKVDRQLVTPIVDSQAQRQLVRSIIDIGKSQDIAICAEGVETARHADLLRDLGCDTLQGYHLARPMPAEAIVAFVAALRQQHRETDRTEASPADMLHSFIEVNQLGSAGPRRAAPGLARRA